MSESVHCSRGALAGGLAIKNMPESIGSAVVKRDKVADQAGAHHAVVGKADYASQEAVLSVILRGDKTSSFITEEHVKIPEFQKRLINSSNLGELKRNGAYVIDELDGSSYYDKGHFGWSVSVGYVTPDLVHESGAIFSPEVFGGTLFTGSGQEGSKIATDMVFREPSSGNYKTRGAFSLRQAQVTKAEKLKEAVVIFGLDCTWSTNPVHNKAVVALSDMGRTPAMETCALGLGLVASGKADLLIQPIQSIWDWSGGKAIVDYAGGQFIFYEMREGLIYPIERLELKHYNPEERMVGFVAGNKTLTEQAMDVLLKCQRDLT